jgi:hypothetical protein
MLQEMNIADEPRAIDRGRMILVREEQNKTTTPSLIDWVPSLRDVPLIPPAKIIKIFGGGTIGTSRRDQVLLAGGLSALQLSPGSLEIWAGDNNRGA